MTDVLSKLDRRTLAVWRIGNLIGWSTLAVALAVAIHVIVQGEPSRLIWQGTGRPLPGAPGFWIHLAIVRLLVSVLIGFTVGGIVGAKVWRSPGWTALGCVIAYEALALTVPFGSSLLDTAGTGSWMVGVNVVLTGVSAAIAVAWARRVYRRHPGGGGRAIDDVGPPTRGADTESRASSHAGFLGGAIASALLALAVGFTIAFAASIALDSAAAELGLMRSLNPPITVPIGLIAAAAAGTSIGLVVGHPAWRLEKRIAGICAAIFAAVTTVPQFISLPPVPASLLRATGDLPPPTLVMWFGSQLLAIPFAVLVERHVRARRYRTSTIIRSTTERRDLGSDARQSRREAGNEAIKTVPTAAIMNHPRRGSAGVGGTGDRTYVAR